MMMSSAAGPNKMKRRRRSRRYSQHYARALLLGYLVMVIHGQEQQEANGLLDALFRFQESLRQQVEGTGTTSGTAAATASQPPLTHNYEPERRSRPVTHRRGLFEHTLQTHYSKFLPHNIVPGGLTDVKHTNVQRASSTNPEQKESWINKAGCVIFLEDGASFWTYEWCPKKRIVQHGRDLVNNLGRWETDVAIISTQFDSFHVQDVNQVEYYANGDYCSPREDKRLRTKIRRRAVVVYEKEPCPDQQELAIIKVSEPQPCQYVFRVCRAAEPLYDMDDDFAMDDDDETVVTEEETKNLQLIEDIQRVTSVFAKTTGVDQADMEHADRTTSLHDALPPFPPSRRKANLDLIREMFTHAYDSYMYNAYPASEVKPLTCRPGTFDLVKLPALTLVDTLDTLVIMRNFTEFARGVERLRDLHITMQYAENGPNEKVPLIGGGLFSTNQNVSLFETNIRVLGGLLSAHQLALAYLENQVPLQHVREKKNAMVMIGPVPEVAIHAMMEDCKTQGQGEAPTCSLTDQDCTTQGYTRGGKATKEKCENITETASTTPYWTYDGFLLELAHDLGKRMIPAFQTKTGIPYGTVNLVDGIPNGESKVASLAGAGTLSLEFELLSRLTGDESFGDEAKLATRALWMRRSKKDLLGKHIHIEKGSWTELLSGIGSNSDSFYEYLVKHYILFPEDEDFWPMFIATYYGVHNHSRVGEWYADVDMNSGAAGAQRRVFESLMAFYPGMQVLLGEISPAAKTLNGFFMVRESVGMLPERYNYGQWRVDGNGGYHPLRPELLESCYFLHKSTEGLASSRANSTNIADVSGWLWAADYSLHTLHWHTWARCGYASIKNVSPQTTGGIPGSQVKNQRPQAVNEMPSFFLSETLKYLYLTFDEDNILHQDNDRDWVFTTEAHPIHHVSVEEYAANSDPRSETRRLRERVLFLLRSRSNRRYDSSSKTKSYAPAARLEKWSEKTSAHDFIKQLVETEKRIVGSRLLQPSSATYGHELLAMDIIQPSFLPIVNSEEEDASKQEMDNIAHLSLASAGLGSSALAITKGCPNIYSPSLSWINALSGGSTDYSNIYVSTIADEFPIDTKHGVGLISASHALALHGTGLFLGKNPVDERESCTLPHRKSGTTQQQRSSTPPESQRFDMGGHLGTFDVALYSEGNGFLIKQVNTGETVIATVVHDDGDWMEEGEENTSPFVMVYSSTPARNKKRMVSQNSPPSTTSWLPGMNWKSVFTRTEQVFSKDSDTEDSPLSRRVIVGDASGYSFSCHVQIVKRTVFDMRHLSSKPTYPIEMEDIVKVFPCAPALFGPTIVPRLVKSNGITVEGKLSAPEPNNEDGCDELDGKVDDGTKENLIKLVKRGYCTFQTKSLNQKVHGANGVVVINSDPSELFLMAHGAEKGTSDDHYPATVLLSGTDGAELVQIAKENSLNSVVAKVVVAPQRIVFDTSGTIHSLSGDLRFPILQVGPEAIQIYSSGGWGVHAVERPIEQATTSDMGKEKKEWQLFLLQHSQTTTTTN